MPSFAIVAFLFPLAAPPSVALPLRLRSCPTSTSTTPAPASAAATLHCEEVEQKPEECVLHGGSNFTHRDRPDNVFEHHADDDRNERHSAAPCGDIHAVSRNEEAAADDHEERQNVRPEPREARKRSGEAARHHRGEGLKIHVM